MSHSIYYTVKRRDKNFKYTEKRRDRKFEYTKKCIIRGVNNEGNGIYFSERSCDKMECI